jgi:hypothetical protein
MVSVEEVVVVEVVVAAEEAVLAQEILLSPFAQATGIVLQELGLVFQ